MAAPKGNQYALGNTGGHPPVFDDAESLNKTISEYFNECIKDEIKATVTGLALRLGFCSRQSLSDYSKRGEEFSYIIKRAKLTVEKWYELSGTSFDIFALKNMGWVDKTEVKHDGEIKSKFMVTILDSGKEIATSELDIESESTL